MQLKSLIKLHNFPIFFWNKLQSFEFSRKLFHELSKVNNLIAWNYVVYDLETCLMDIIHIWNTMDLWTTPFFIKNHYNGLVDSQPVAHISEEPLCKPRLWFNLHCYLFDSFFWEWFLIQLMKHASYTRNSRMRNIIWFFLCSS